MCDGQNSGMNAAVDGGNPTQFSPGCHHLLDFVGVVLSSPLPPPAAAPAAAPTLLAPDPEVNNVRVPKFMGCSELCKKDFIALVVA